MIELKQILKWNKKILPIVLGMSVGYAYYYFIGCVYGTCPITSNPWTSILYGGIVGAFFIRKNN